MKKLLIFLMIVFLTVTPALGGGNQELRQSTSQFITIHGVAAIADGYTPVTTLQLSAADSAIILKQGTSTVTDISAFTLASLTGSDGSYVITATASATDTLGNLTVCIIDTSLCYPVYEYCSVLPANVWDSKYSTDILHVSLYEIDSSGSDQTVDDLEDFADSGYDPVNHGTNVYTVRDAAPAAGDGSDFTAIPNVGIDWSNITNTSTSVTLTNTTILKLIELDEDHTTIDLNGTTVNATASAPFYSTTVSDSSTVMTFTLAGGVTASQVYNGFLITVTDADGDNVPEPAFVRSYTDDGSILTVNLSSALSFLPANGDVVQFWPGFGRGTGTTIYRRKGL